MSSKIGVSHELSEFDNNPMILTLEDKPIIDCSGKLDEGEDVLHNVSLREKEIYSRNNRRKAKLSDVEDKFGDSFLLNPENILAKYDEPEVDFRKEKFKISLGKDGIGNRSNLSSQAEAPVEFDRIRQKLRDGSSILNDLRNNRELSSDYFTVEEAARLSGKTTKTLKRKRRQKDKNEKSDQTKKVKDTKEGEAEDMFEVDLKENFLVVSRGSRRERERMLNGIKADEKLEKKTLEKDETVEVDLEKMRQEQREEFAHIQEGEKQLLQKINNDEFDEEDDVDLQNVIVSQRLKNLRSFDITKITERIREKVLKQSESNFDEIIKKGDYNETEDFLNNLNHHHEQWIKKDDYFKEEKLDGDLREDSSVASSKEEKPLVKEMANENKPSDSERKEGILKVETIAPEPLVSTSISDALRLLKMRGLLGKKDRHDYFGRENDEKPSFFKEIKDVAPEIRLEHYDPVTGKLLTRKQAFRNMSHVFHGRKPSDIRKSKIRRHVTNIIENRAKVSTETPTGLVAKLKNVAKKTGKPFVELDQNKNAALIALNEDFSKIESLGRRMKRATIKRKKNRSKEAKE